MNRIKFCSSCSSLISGLLIAFLTLLLLTVALYLFDLGSPLQRPTRLILTIASISFFLLLAGAIAVNAMQKAFIKQPGRTVIAVEPDHLGNAQPLSRAAPIILRFDIYGVIGLGDLTTSQFEIFFTDIFNSLIEKERVHAIMLHINSPGGTDTDSAGIYSLIKELKEELGGIPVYAYVDGMCASGGVYIACAADKIFASNSSKIGSVGVVVGPLINLHKGMEKLGIESETIYKGKRKDLFNPLRKWEVDEGKSLEALATLLYDQFLDVVTNARPKIKKEQLKEEIGADLFIAKTAQELGFIDEVGLSYKEALKSLAEAAKLDNYQVYSVFRPRQFLEDLNMKIPAAFSLPFNLPTHRQFLFLHNL